MQYLSKVLHIPLNCEFKKSLKRSCSSQVLEILFATLMLERLNWSKFDLKKFQVVRLYADRYMSAGIDSLKTSSHAGTVFFFSKERATANKENLASGKYSLEDNLVTLIFRT